VGFPHNESIPLPFGVMVRTRSSTVMLARPFFLVKALCHPVPPHLPSANILLQQNAYFQAAFVF